MAKKTKILLCAAIAVLGLGTVVAVSSFTSDKTLLPDRAPIEVDSNAVIEAQSDDKLTTPPGGGACSLSYGKDISIDLSAGNASLYFSNGGSSLQNVAVTLVVQDTAILQSGLLPPGGTLKSLTLPEEGIPLQQGGYDGELWVQFYDEAGTPLPVNTQLKGMTIEVK